MRRGIAALVPMALMLLASGCGGDDDDRDEVGVAPEGQAAMTLVGRIDQDGKKTRAYGYLTDIERLSRAQLFAGARFDERPSAARFTFSASGTIRDRSILSNVIATDSEATMHVYLQSEPAGDFRQPQSFARGKRIASYEVRFHNIITVTAPNRGIATATGQLEQRRAERFSPPGGEERRLGHEGLVTRLSLTGSGTRTNPTLPRAFLLVAGEIVVAGNGG
jgi:hypothetical protein